MHKIYEYLRSAATLFVARKYAHSLKRPCKMASKSRDELNIELAIVRKLAQQGSVRYDQNHHLTLLQALSWMRSREKFAD